jgi:undecaprenyl diphosphate synthase
LPQAWYNASTMELHTIPQHVAIIPDGNRRWAKTHSFELTRGHEIGADKFWDIAQTLSDNGVTYVTIWAASLDNLKKRSQMEVLFLVTLVKKQLSNPAVIQRFIDTNVKVQIIGEWNKAIHDDELDAAILNIQAQTAHFEGKTVTMLFGYSGTDEMLAAINSLVTSGASVDAQSLKQALATGKLPPVDLVIRTGGEPHWSAGFMMWHTANSQLYFTETLWPDFSTEETLKALQEYAARERRLGK